MLKTGQIKRCEGLEKLGRHVAGMRNPIMFFSGFPKKNCEFCFGTRFGYVKKHKLFITAFTIIHWVKPVWLAEPIFSTDGALRGVHTVKYR